MEQQELRELVESICKVLHDNVISIILYGSVVRGTNTEESDVDIAVLVTKRLSHSIEDALSDAVVDLNLKYNRVFSIIDIDYDEFQKWKQIIPFYKNVSNEGVVLWKAA